MKLIKVIKSWLKKRQNKKEELKKIREKQEYYQRYF